MGLKMTDERIFEIVKEEEINLSKEEKEEIEKFLMAKDEVAAYEFMNKLLDAVGDIIKCINFFTIIDKDVFSYVSDCIAHTIKKRMGK